ncbi:MAG TPA: nucleotidyltransferase domain-containing protein [Candidatus Nanoarchaeia archaeon]|nr:nucleotidyltransferase domain-containing protein [Candidatus Nanoarchaeia archaeon]
MFTKYVPIKILEFFLRNPTREIYLKELSRTLKISSGSASNILKYFLKQNYLKLKIEGNLHKYKLNNDSLIVKQMKVINNLFLLEKYINLLKKEDVYSIILYGSYANGTNIEESDIDILIISNLDFLKETQIIEQKLEKEVNIDVLSIEKWKNIKRKDRVFYDNIMRNHIILYGEFLI